MLALRLARTWGRDPSWFYTLEREDQLRVLALDRIEYEQAKEASK